MIDVNTFDNFGFLSAEVPPEAMQEIRATVLDMQKDFSSAVPFNDQLVGHIKHEYEINTLKPLLAAPLLELAYEYDKEFNYLSTIAVSQKNLSLNVGNLWANFQKKGEYNPTHIHTGVYSFALWVTIPYTREQEEVFTPTVHPHNNKNGCFAFSYITSLGGINEKSIPLDKSYEGKVVFFPASMRHSVYPFFSSDEYRVSISGNIYLGEV